MNLLINYVFHINKNNTVIFILTLFLLIPISFCPDVYSLDENLSNNTNFFSLYHNIDRILAQLNLAKSSLNDTKSNLSFETMLFLHSSIYPNIRDDIRTYFPDQSLSIETKLSDLPLSIRDSKSQNEINYINTEIINLEKTFHELQLQLLTNSKNSNELILQSTVSLLDDAYASYSTALDSVDNAESNLIDNLFPYKSSIGFLNKSNVNYNSISSLFSANVDLEVDSFYNDLYNNIQQKNSLESISQVINAIKRDLVGENQTSESKGYDVYFSTIDNLLNQLLVEVNQNNDYKKADKLAISAYLDNFEYLEPPLETVNSTLMLKIELLMREELRQLLKNQSSKETITSFVEDIKNNLQDAQNLLRSNVDIQNASNISANSSMSNIEALKEGFGTFSGTAKKMGEADDLSKEGVRNNIDQIRINLNNMLQLYKDGRYDESFSTARMAYLDSYEHIEIPLRPIDPDFTLEMEIKFAELRNLIQQKEPYGKVLSKTTEILKGLDESERLVSGTGIVAPTIAFSTSFSLIFREGLESALIIGAIITYLEASRNDRFKKHVYYGIFIAVGATIITWIVAQYVIEISGASRELIEAIAGVSAVGVLFWVSFWILNKIETKKWIEFVKSKVWQATTTGSVLVFVMLSFFTIYREGFETVLFYQAMLSFSKYMELYVIAGLFAGLGVIIAVAYAVKIFGKKLPLRVLFGLTMGIGAYMSIAFIGNAAREFQELGYISTTHLFGIIPRLDVNLASMTGIHPTLETVIAQIILLSVYLVGSFYILIIQPRRKSLIASSRKSMSDLKK